MSDAYRVALGEVAIDAATAAPHVLARPMVGSLLLGLRRACRSDRHRQGAAWKRRRHLTLAV